VAGKNISLGRPALDSGRNRIYITDRVDTLYALDLTDRQNGETFPTANEWSFGLGDATDFMPGIDLPLGTGTVYSDEFGSELRAVKPDGDSKWVAAVASDIDSTPAVGADGTIYFGKDIGKFTALNPNGSPKWEFPGSGNIGSVQTSPALGPDGTIYFGSNDNNLYALNPDVSSAAEREKFSFSATGDVRSSPTVDQGDEAVFFGSDDTNVYAVNQLAEPRNFRDNSVEPKKLISSVDFPEISFSDINDSNNWLKHDNGLWAVRFEVIRQTIAGGKGEYRLKTWVEKCTTSGCSKIRDALFRDTLITYDVAAVPPKLEQVITLSALDHAKFERLLFGFTSQAIGTDTQQAVIRFFELSFSRPSDPLVTSDPILVP
jgi:hypothetical protein